MTASLGMNIFMMLAVQSCTYECLAAAYDSGLQFVEKQDIGYHSLPFLCITKITL